MSWSYGSWIYNYWCNQCLSPLMLWVRISIRARCTTLFDKVCQWLATSRWFSPGPPVSSTNKTDRHIITEILLNLVLCIININLTQISIKDQVYIFLNTADCTQKALIEFIQKYFLFWIGGQAIQIMLLQYNSKSTKIWLWIKLRIVKIKYCLKTIH